MKVMNLNPAELTLDSENPRFSIFNFSDESEIIAYLKNYENLEQLKDSIKTHGYNDLGEPIIVLEDDSNYIVLEGNRRIAALKDLSSKDDKFSTSVRCDVVDNRSDAIFKIASKHISGIKEWSPIDKKIFYETQFAALRIKGLTKNDAITKIKENSPETKSAIQKDISSYYFVKSIYDILDENYKIDKHITQLPTDLITTRFYNRIKDSLNLTLNDDLKFEINDDKREIFNNILLSIGEHSWIKNTVDSRNINTNKDFKRMLETKLKDLGTLLDEYKNNSRASNTPSEKKSNNSECKFEENITQSKKTPNQPNDDHQDTNQPDKLEKDIIKIFFYNDNLEINKLPHNLRRNVTITINDTHQKDSMKQLIFSSTDKSNLILDKGNILKGSKDGTYAIDVRFNDIQKTMTVCINQETISNTIKFFDIDVFNDIVNKLSDIKNSNIFKVNKLYVTYRILNELDLSNEKDIIIATPLVRNVIEYSLQLFSHLSNTSLAEIDKNLAGTFNQVKNIIYSPSNAHRKNCSKALSTVSKDLKNLNSFIHDGQLSPPPTFLKGIIDGSMPLLLEIYNLYNSGQ